MSLPISALFGSIALVATACHPTIDFDLDLEPGPVLGDRGEVTFAFVDGCVNSDPLFGCPETLPGFAVGSQARFIIGSVTGEPDDESRLRRAKATSKDRAIVSASRDVDGVLYLDSLGEGDTTIEIVEDGDVLDTIDVHVEPIARLEAGAAGVPQPYLLGAAFPVGVNAYGPTNQRLFAHGAIGAQTHDGLALDTEHVGYFTGSDQFAVISDTAGLARLDVWGGTLSATRQFKIVTRDELTEVVIDELAPTPDSNKVTLIASTRINGTLVSGGPGCDWRIVSGGGPGVALSSKVGDGFTTALFVFYDSAIVFGSGETIVECRANDRVVAQHTIQFAP